jgi:hypothetical protein
LLLIAVLSFLALEKAKWVENIPQRLENQCADPLSIGQAW